MQYAPAMEGVRTRRGNVRSSCCVHRGWNVRDRKDSLRFAKYGRIENVKKNKYTLSKEQEEMLSAALRHTRDARRLLLGQEAFVESPDQSWHLAGFGFECLRKACLFERWGDKALGHDVEESEVLAMFLALDAHAWRYRLQTRETIVGEWRPDARYVRTGTYDAPKARELVDFVEKNVEVVTALLWADGRLLDPAI